MGPLSGRIPHRISLVGRVAKVGVVQTQVGLPEWEELPQQGDSTVGKVPWVGVVSMVGGATRAA